MSIVIIVAWLIWCGCGNVGFDLVSVMWCCNVDCVIYFNSAVCTLSGCSRCMMQTIVFGVRVCMLNEMEEV